MQTPTIANQPAQIAPRYDDVATVPLRSGDTRSTVQQALGGTLLSWTDEGCAAGEADACQAVVGFNHEGTLSAQSVAALNTRFGRPVTIEPNRDQFSGGGELTATIGGSLAAWAGGSLAAWAGGSLAAWAGGTYAPLPQNTGVWTTLHLQAAQALAPNLGANVTVAVIDTGLDLTHPAFQNALTDPATWWDYYGGDAVPQDEGTLGTGGFGHGTNVAGIILQIAPNAKILPIRVLGPDGSGDVVNIASAITWAAAHGANIINLSLGSAQAFKGVQDAITAATKKGVLVVSSAGNNNRSAITFPASTSTKIAGLVSVGSVDAQDVKSTFSNYADALELMAPGEQVYAPAPGNLLAAWSGTSQATPMAAGALALALGQHLLTPKLTDILMNSAVNIYSNPLNKQYTNKLGEGRLDLSAFLSKASQASMLP
ncbi:serine protease [Deinococcus ruber]|uniref:Serine protease n=1 Tax=Deinococcus ruber TaxID=1848197 RepID=A0A918F9U8_9DEIO|nr:serine protease [Deinococcus ruber]